MGQAKRESKNINTSRSRFPLAPDGSVPLFRCRPFAARDLVDSSSGDGGGEAQEPVRSVENHQALCQWRRLRHARHLCHPAHRYGQGILQIFLPLIRPLVGCAFALIHRNMIMINVVFSGESESLYFLENGVLLSVLESSYFYEI